MIKHEPDTYGWAGYVTEEIERPEGVPADCWTWKPDPGTTVVGELADCAYEILVKLDPVKHGDHVCHVWWFATPGDRKRFIDQLRIERLVELSANRSDRLVFWKRHMSNPKALSDLIRK